MAILPFHLESHILLLQALACQVLMNMGFLAMFSFIPEEYLSFIADFAKIVIPAFCTFLVTRYTLNRPRKYEIRNKQFDLVYLPLYLLTRQYCVSTQNMELYFRKVDRIFYKNYQYVFPRTLKLFDKLKTEWCKGNKNSYHLIKFESQVNSDYEKLKQELGYPTSSIFEFFKRLSGFDKFLYFVIFILGTAAVWGISCFFLFLFNGEIGDAVTSLISGAASFFAVYIFSYIMRH